MNEHNTIISSLQGRYAKMLIIVETVLKNDNFSMLVDALTGLICFPQRKKVIFLLAQVLVK